MAIGIVLQKHHRTFPLLTKYGVAYQEGVKGLFVELWENQRASSLDSYTWVIKVDAEGASFGVGRIAAVLFLFSEVWSYIVTLP